MLWGSSYCTWPLFLRLCQSSFMILVFHPDFYPEGFCMQSGLLPFHWDSISGPTLIIQEFSLTIVYLHIQKTNEAWKWTTVIGWMFSQYWQFGLLMLHNLFWKLWRRKLNRLCLDTTQTTQRFMTRFICVSLIFLLRTRSVTSGNDASSVLWFIRKGGILYKTQCARAYSFSLTLNLVNTLQLPTHSCSAGYEFVNCRLLSFIQDC